MQINGKTLLNSAESILRERHKENRAGGASSGAESSRSADALAEGLAATPLEARLLRLQASLGAIQREYSREQARYSYLTQNPDEISPDLKFGDEPLFPELRAGFDPARLKDEVQGALDRLTRSLKGAQVEMENVYALNFNQPPDTAVDAARLLENNGLKDLDPARVARLTRG